MPRVRLDGGVIGVTNNPTSASAGGMWSFSEHSKYTRSAGWPAASAAVGTINASALVIAGGGGGGSTSGGGGGAGGYISNNLIQILNTTNYSITVGAGGAAGTSVADAGNGSNSTFSSLTAVGGGGGGNASLTPPGKAKGGGLDGGSGGGGSFVGSGTSGGIGGSNTVGQGYAGGNGWIAGDGNGTYAVGGGGGGASAVGATGTQNVAGNGGAGTSSSITGTSTSYAGGGGGGVNTNAGGTRGTGGTGGGGSGGNASTASSAGTVNTGGGGGGAYSTNNGSAGGSGIVVINYPAPQQFTGGTITNVINAAGSNIVHTFTSSGSLNALGYSIDTYFPQTTLLLHGDGTNGANNTLFLDSSANTYIPAATGTTYSNYFNGSSDYLATPSTALLSPGTGDYTTEVWVRFNTIPSSGKGILNGQASYTQNIYYDGGTYNTNVLAISNRVSNPILYSWVPTANTWYHIAVSRASSTLRLFINGTLVANTTDNTNYNGTASHTIGGDAGNGAGWSFPGYISNLRVVTGTALYTASFTPPTAPLTTVAGTQLLTSQSARFVDNSNNNLTITQTGGPLISSGGVPVATNGKPYQGTFSPFSQTGWSNYFNGSSDYIVTPAGSSSLFEMGSGDYTVEFWFYALSNSDGGLVFKGLYQSGATWQAGFGVRRLSATQLRFTFNTSGTAAGEKNYDYTTTTNTNQWYHVAMVVSGGVGYAFVNGTLANAGGLASIGTIPTSSTSITIGAFPYNVGYFYFNGYISNVRIIKGTALYTSSFTPPTTPLTAVTNTQLLTCQDNRFKDNSINVLSITPSGTPSVQPFSPFSPSSAYSNTTVGGSAYFSTKTDGLDLSGTADLTTFAGNFTIESWVYPTDTSLTNFWTLYDGRASGGTSAAFIFGLGNYSSGYQLQYFNSGTTVNSTGRVQVNSWSHVALERVGTTATFYINGQASNTFTLSGTLTASGSGGTIRIGSKDSGLSGYGILGNISNYRITNGTAVYNGNFTPSTAPYTSSSVSNTKLLLNSTNAGIIDQTAKNTLTTYGAAAISNTQSKFGGTSMYFNGSTGYVTVTGPANMHAFGIGDWTVEMWAYFSSTSGTQVLFDNRPAGTASTTNYAALELVSGSLHYYTATGNPSINGGALSSGQWYHIALCRSGTSTKLFVNGTQVGSTLSDSQSYLNGTNRPIFGADGNNLGSLLNGYLDDIRISKFARYTSNFTPPTSAFLDR